MKKIISFIPDWILTLLLGVIFLATWPLIFIFIGVKALFDRKSTDEDKILGAKLAVVTIFGLILVLVSVKYWYQISDFFGFL